jgi:membrane-bound lytic murein transglycosylase D
MKIFRIIAVAFAAAFIATPAEAQNKKLLMEENTQLKQVIDSLKLEMEKVRAELAYTDSIANEMLSLYADSEAKSSEPLAVEEYTTAVSDSLLSIYYIQKKIAQSEEDYYDMDSVRFQSNVPDSAYIERIRQMNSFITLPYNDIVKNYIIKYSEKMPTSIGNILGLNIKECHFFADNLFQHISELHG